ncbi:MAG: hypothetical protein ACREL7_02445 [Longimicrobiales bacterium]
MSKSSRTPLVLAIASTLLLHAATLRAQVTPVSAPAPNPARAAEALDMGLFRWPAGDTTGALGGTLVRVTRGGRPDHLLVLWYGGRTPMWVTAGAPMVLLADDDTLQAPSLGRVQRETAADGNASETAAYRFTELQLRRLALAGSISLRIFAEERILECEFTAENMHRLRLFVNGVVRGS